MTRSSDNLELVLFVWMDALRRNDPEQIAPYLAHEIVWQGLRRDLLCRDRDAVLDNIRSGAQHRRRVSGLEIAAVDDDHVLLAVRLPGVAELRGEPIAGELFDVFTLRGGMIVRVDEFKTRREAIDAVHTAPHNMDQSDRVEPASNPMTVHPVI